MNASIVIPAYNAEKTLGECINALQKQDFSEEFEVIVVDDGSTDKTAEIVKDFSKKNKKIKLIQQKNSGPATARNRGAMLAKSEIILFLDADCIAEKQWLKEMLKPFSDKQVSGVQGAYKSKQKELIAQFSQLEIEHRYAMMQKQKSIDWVGSYSAAYRKKIFLQEKGFDEGFLTSSGEDPELSFKLAEKGHRLVFNPKAIVFHYHQSSLWKYLKTKYYRGFWRVRLYKKHAKKIFADSYTPQEIKFQIIFFYLGVLLLLDSIFFREAFFYSGIFFFLIIASSLPFSFFALKKYPAVTIVAPIIIFFRTIAFSFGLLAGALNKRVLK